MIFTFHFTLYSNHPREAYNTNLVSGWFTEKDSFEVILLLSGIIKQLKSILVIPFK